MTYEAYCNVVMLHDLLNIFHCLPFRLYSTYSDLSHFFINQVLHNELFSFRSIFTHIKLQSWFNIGK